MSLSIGGASWRSVLDGTDSGRHRDSLVPKLTDTVSGDLGDCFDS